MARAELEDLYRSLMAARFEFIPRGEIHLRGIYAVIKDRYPELCDDGYLCATNCKSGYNSPEWRHTVRTPLNAMKKQGEPITTGSARGMWRFGPATVTVPDAHGFAAVEGRSLFRLHKVKERKPRLVRRKKQAVLAATGRLLCEVCDFDFVTAYGALGQGFAECHHRVPLAALNGDTPTRLADLAIVCANCHRMLHRGRQVLGLDDLRRLVNSRRNAPLLL